MSSGLGVDQPAADAADRGGDPVEDAELEDRSAACGHSPCAAEMPRISPIVSLLLPRATQASTSVSRSESAGGGPSVGDQHVAVAQVRELADPLELVQRRRRQPAHARAEAEAALAAAAVRAVDVDADAVAEVGRAELRRGRPPRGRSAGAGSRSRPSRSARPRRGPGRAAGCRGTAARRSIAATSSSGKPSATIMRPVGVRRAERRQVQIADAVDVGAVEIGRRRPPRAPPASRPPQPPARIPCTLHRDSPANRGEASTRAARAVAGSRPSARQVTRPIRRSRSASTERISRLRGERMSRPRRRAPSARQIASLPRTVSRQFGAHRDRPLGDRDLQRLQRLDLGRDRAGLLPARLELGRLLLEQRLDHPQIAAQRR